MGQSSSTARRRRRYTTEISSTTTTNNYTSPSFSHQPSPPPPPLPPPPPSTSTSSNYPYYTPNPYNHPPPNPNYYYSSSNSYPPPSYEQQLTHAVNSIVTFIESLIKPTTTSGTGSRPNTNVYYNNYGPPPNRFSRPSVPTQPLPGHPPPPPSSLQQPPPQFVESQNAKTVKNEVNIHKDTIRFIFDEKNDHHLLSFTFDASADGSITIYYFAKEEEETCIFSPAYPDIYKPTKFSFQEGPGQTFYQPPGSGINLGFFAQEDLSNPLDGNIFPLIICMNNKETTCAQITEAIIEKTNSGSFQAKVIKQILLVNGERYELQEIYGLVNSERHAESNDDSDGDESGKECVICLSEPRNTAVFPCRHMCMCSDCAKALRTQSNKCPICRQPVEKLMEINVNRGN